MIFLRRLHALLILFSFLFSCAARSQTGDAKPNRTVAKFVVRAARMLDAAQGKIIDNPVVLIENDRIAAVADAAEIPKDATLIDLGDATLLPGLIDAHTHITYHFDEQGRFGESSDANPQVTLKYAEENARLTLEAGFTTIRNLGDATGVDVFLRDRISSGETSGPRMIVSGLPLTVETLRYAGKKGDRIEQIRAFVRDRIAERVDVVKIFEGVDNFGNPIFSVKEMRAGVEEARRANLKVAVHAHEAAAVRAAVEAGCDSVEHGTFLNDEAIRLMAKNRIALVPTLYLPTHYVEHKKQFVFGAPAWNLFETMRSRNLENMKKARKGGVLIVDGSDAVAGLHGRNAREIAWLVKAGMSPAEAIRAATVDAAELLGLKQQVGEIKAGLTADLIAVPGNPLNDISSLERVSFVMKSGKIIKSKL
ncbi:MAG TPA: amidohydrolase family protein [Pyrinomonadaceae bacterium]|jgi:imidazolonepropionase-like amidohydrolase